MHAHLHDLEILHVFTLRLHQFTYNIIPFSIRAICGGRYRRYIQTHGIEGFMRRKCRGRGRRGNLFEHVRREAIDDMCHGIDNLDNDLDDSERQKN